MKMKIDLKKLERQQIGVEKWFNANKRGTLNYAAGVGKTYTAILIIKRLFRMYYSDNHNVIIIVPSEELQNQWNVELSKYLSKKSLISVEVFTVHWIVNNKIKIKTDTVIYDEIHEYLGEEFFGVVNGTYIRYQNALALTATYEDSKGRHSKLKSLLPIIDLITEEEAIKKEWISPFIEFNLAIELTYDERMQYEKHTTIISNNINKFGRSGLDLAVKCLGGGKHSNGIKYEGTHFVYGWAAHKGWRRNLNLENPQDKQINDIWNPHKIFGYAQKLLNAIRHRKNLLYNCENKLEVSKELVFKFNELKTIIFSQSTSFADKLNLFLNEEEEKCSVVYHSNLQTILMPSPKTGKLIKFGKTRLKREAIEFIRQSKKGKICTASSLDKGFDVQDIRLGITASGTSNFTQYKQRRGRTGRIDILNPDKVALLINLYVKDSKEEIWLKKRQSKSTHGVYWADYVHEISFNPIDKDEFTINDI